MDHGSSFLNNFISYEVNKYIHGLTNATGSSTLTPLTPKELKVDKIVLSWIFTTLSDALQARLVVARPKTAKEAWDLITDIVKDNKRSCTVALKAELRSIRLGDLSMEAYFGKIESIVTILTSLDSPVNDEDVVHCALEGLSNKYDQVCGIMHHKDTFSRSQYRSIDAHHRRDAFKVLFLPVDSSSYSPLVLMANHALINDPLLLKLSHGGRALILLKVRVGLVIIASLSMIIMLRILIQVPLNLRVTPLMISL
nr:hybrid signal transduction histidine kinase M [Tanacetum cinerariifolium]